MNLDGARVYFEGMTEKDQYDEKIHQIVNTIKSLSPSSEVSMRLLKSGNLYEGILWGKVSDVPISFYDRGQSMNHLLDTLYRKAKKQSVKVLKMKKTPHKVYPKGQTDENPIDLASWKRKKFIRKLLRNINDLIIIPIAVWATLAL